VKLGAFVISGCLTSMIGAVWFFYLTQVQPNTGFDPLFDLLVVLMAFFGGYGSISGPVLGALIIEPGTLWLNTQVSSYVSEIMLGVIFLVIVLFVPRGIIPTSSERITRIRTRGRPAVVPAPGDDPPPGGAADPPGAPRAPHAARASRGGGQ
ncbi:MAG TPA: hypothetical protein VFV73_35710, partial [Streptosporangiaceae bacterium]|nr:hypothetical protein [Streptosporangiaceae bacterium]